MTLSLMSICHDWKAQLLVEYSKDRQACDILDGIRGDDHYQVMDGVIYYKGLRYLVPGSQLRGKILNAAHYSSLLGHQGFLKTYRIVKECFTWRGLKGGVLRLVKECEACLGNKGELTHPAGLQQPLPIPGGKSERISMDFITGLPMVQGHDCIYVVVDRLTNYAHFFAIPTRYIALQVAELFFREVFRLHGLPKTIINDKDNPFMGAFS